MKLVKKKWRICANENATKNECVRYFCNVGTNKNVLIKVKMFRKRGSCDVN